MKDCVLDVIFFSKWKTYRILLHVYTVYEFKHFFNADIHVSFI